MAADVRDGGGGRAILRFVFAEGWYVGGRLFFVLYVGVLEV